MRIVIDISDTLYDRLVDMNIDSDTGSFNESALVEAIQNGTPLPKGHGDIVDIETLVEMFWDGNSMEITKYDLSVIEPIIEADKESAEV